jgi:hypothetical protein
MSVPLPGWFASLEERPIAVQLEDGIRGLLLDTHYADRLSNGRTRTYFMRRRRPPGGPAGRSATRASRRLSASARGSASAAAASRHVRT